MGSFEAGEKSGHDSNHHRNCYGGRSVRDCSIRGLVAFHRSAHTQASTPDAWRGVLSVVWHKLRRHGSRASDAGTCLALFGNTQAEPTPENQFCPLLGDLLSSVWGRSPLLLRDRKFGRRRAMSSIKSVSVARLSALQALTAELTPPSSPAAPSQTGSSIRPAESPALSESSPPGRRRWHRRRTGA